MNRSTVVIELAGDAQFARDLSAGGVFVPGCALAMAEECDLVVCGANDQLLLAARVVYVEPQRGAGLELIGFSSEMKARLAELEPINLELELYDEPVSDEPLDDRVLDDDDPGMNAPVASVAVIDLDALAALDVDGASAEDDLALTVESERLDDRIAYDRRLSDAVTTRVYQSVGSDPALRVGRLGDADTLPPDGATGHDPDDDTLPQDEPDPNDPEERARRRIALNVHERLRGISLAAQVKLASTGELQERVVLERLYGKNVWEPLLRNPRLTAPEVARIARYGSLPRVLLEIIVGNGAWLQIPEVRRALLANPRLGTDQILKVLRLTPKHELKLAAIQTAYPHAVRLAARTMLRGE